MYKNVQFATKNHPQSWGTKYFTAPKGDDRLKIKIIKTYHCKSLKLIYSGRSGFNFKVFSIFF